jgi:hypothetical protein
MNNIRENLFFAFFYNTLGVPLAAGVLYPAFGVLLNPMIAAAAMSFSSVSVIAKGTLITENSWKQSWMPQISTGFMLRTQVRNVGGQMQNKDTTNADIYLVATKTITQLKPMSLILSGGVQGTNAELLGLEAMQASGGQSASVPSPSVPGASEERHCSWG